MAKTVADWRKAMIERVRVLIKQADPDVVEEQKYKMPSNPGGVPVWYHDGMICTGETLKHHLRFAFAKGPQLKDPKGLINSYRAIILREGDKLNEKAFKDLIKEAVALNTKHQEDKKKARKKK